MPEGALLSARRRPLERGRALGFAALLLALAAFAPSTGLRDAAAQQSPAASPRTSIWDGVYTSEQATLGERIAYVSCFSCHTAADWTSSRFLDPDPTQAQKLGDLFAMISRSMPMDSPGKLRPTEYAAVIAYMLKLQGAPAGERELPADLAEMDRILVTRRPRAR